MGKTARQYITAFGKWGFLLAAILVGDILGIVQVYEPSLSIPQYVWWLILVFILIVSPIIAFHKLRVQRDTLQEELDEISNSIPNIVLKRVDESFEGPVTERYWSNFSSGWFIGSSEYAKFTRVWIANDPKNSIQGVDAIQLYCEIEFWDEINKAKLFVMGGRWAETEEVATGGKPIKIDQIDIPPNGRPYCIDIGLKYLNEEEFYGYNNETPLKGAKGFRDKDRRLRVGQYLIKTRFRCRDVDKSFWFRLTNYGKDKEVDFTSINEPVNLDKVESQN